MNETVEVARADEALAMICRAEIRCGQAWAAAYAAKKQIERAAHLANPANPFAGGARIIASSVDGRPIDDEQDWLYAWQFFRTRRLGKAVVVVL